MEDGKFDYTAIPKKYQPKVKKQVKDLGIEACPINRELKVKDLEFIIKLSNHPEHECQTIVIQPKASAVDYTTMGSDVVLLYAGPESIAVYQGDIYANLYFDPKSETV